jgi:hypothetical protein
LELKALWFFNSLTNQSTLWCSAKQLLKWENFLFLPHPTPEKLVRFGKVEHLAWPVS